MLNEEEKKAIELLENIKNNSWTVKYIMSSDSKNADILLNLITKLQKENEEKDKQIDLMADILQDNLYLTPLDRLNREEIKQYFEKLSKEKVEDK